MKIEAIFFDHDGTLVDSESAHYTMWTEILAHHGVHLAPDHYAKYYAGMPSLQNAQDAVTHFELSNLNPHDLAQIKTQMTADFVQKTAFPLMSGAHSVVCAAHEAGYRLAVVTGAHPPEVNATLRVHALSNCFETVVCASDVAISKPAPDCYVLALKRLRLPAQACIALEDTEFGVAAAVGAGIRTIAIPNAVSSHQNFSQAQTILPNLEAAWAWIQAHNCA